MEHLSSKRIKSTSPSFIRGILETAADPEIISFAGGLPNSVSLPQEEFLVSMERIIRDYGSSLFQYSATAGLPELCQYIADRYNRKFGLALGTENTLITTGSQQTLDLISKVLLNTGDGVIVKKPSYLGTIQAFSQYQPVFYPVELTGEGMDIGQLKDALAHDVKFIYTIPDFQNPTGLNYSAENRECIRKVPTECGIVLVEGDPYRELHFDRGGRIPYIGADRLPDSILLGTFLKTVTPGMRTGFMICTNTELLEHISVAKEASDLHANIFSQYLIQDCLMCSDYDAHIPQTRRLYKEQTQAMTEAMGRYFPKTVKYTRPRDGMFLWVTLPEGVSALSLFPKALKKKAVFVPGGPFYISMTNIDTVRLSYTDANCRMIDEGVRRLEELLREI